MKLTDEQKTRRLAEGVMGWEIYTHDSDDRVITYADGTRLVVAVYWQPLHNESHAAEVRERMRALGWWWEILTSDTRDYIRMEHRRDGNPVSVKMKPGDIPRGICHAALLALGLATEEEL